MQAFVRKNRFFKEEKWCFLPPCTESGMKEIKRQLCVKDVFIYWTVSWAPIPYKNLRYRLDTMTYSTLRINIKQLHACSLLLIPQYHHKMEPFFHEQIRSKDQSCHQTNEKTVFATHPLSSKQRTNAIHNSLFLPENILSYIEIMQIFSASWSKRIQLSGCYSLTFRDTDFWLKKFLDLRLEQA